MTGIAMTIHEAEVMRVRWLRRRVCVAMTIAQAEAIRRARIGPSRDAFHTAISHDGDS